MKRKVSMIMIIVLLSLQLSACTHVAVNNDASGKVISPGEEGKKTVISIIVPKGDPITEYDWMSSYRRMFEKKYGVEINCIAIGDARGEKGREDYFEKLALMLHKKDGAELILSNWYNMNTLIAEKAVVNLRGKVPNLDKVYDALLRNETYYVPIGMSYMGTALNKKVLDGLNIAVPDLGWTKQDYYAMKERWLAEGERPFTTIEFYDIVDKYIGVRNIIDQANNKAKINTQEMRDIIKSIRDEIYSGKYKLNKDYSYENYYNLLFDDMSEEAKTDWEYLKSDEYKGISLRDIDMEGFCNILVSENNDSMFKHYNLAVMPQYKKEDSNILDLNTWGFLINKNGKEQELACEFINGLLSDEVQLKLLDKPTGIFCHYPVVNTVEDDISSMEKEKQLSVHAIELKEYALNKIKDGEIDMDFYADEKISRKERKLFSMVFNDISKYIFADKTYSGEELSKELQGLEDKYNIWLNE